MATGGFGGDFFDEVLGRARVPLKQFSGGGDSYDFARPLGVSVPSANISRMNVDIGGGFDSGGFGQTWQRAASQFGVSPTTVEHQPYYPGNYFQNWQQALQATGQQKQAKQKAEAQARAPSNPTAGTPVRFDVGVAGIEVTNLGPSQREEFYKRAMAIGMSLEGQTGIPAEVYAAIAASESNYGNMSRPALFGIKAEPGRMSQTFATPEGPGAGGNRIENHAFNVYNNSYEAFADFSAFLERNPRYARAVQGIREGWANRDTFVQMLNQAGYAEDTTWATRLITPMMNEAAKYRPQAQQLLQTVQQTHAGNTPAAVAGGPRGVDQYSLGLSPADADAFCGPAAAIDFARAMGRNPTVLEAMELGKQNGWTQQGMGTGPSRGGTYVSGPQGVVNILRDMGISAYLESWQNQTEKIKNEVLAGRPVIIDTPGHYYQVTGYNQQLGTFVYGDAVGARAGFAGAPLNNLPGQNRFGAARYVIFSRNAGDAAGMASQAP